MHYEIIGAFNLVDDAVFFYFLSIALGCAAALTAWIESGEPNDKEEIHERLFSAVRSASDLISFMIIQREDKSSTEDLDNRQSDFSGKEKVDADNASNGDSENSPSVTAETNDNSESFGSSVNHVQTWRQDYWNFENSTDGNLFAADEEKKLESEKWRESLEEDNETGRANESSANENKDAHEDERYYGRANFFGAFFRNRNYPSDIYDESTSSSDDDPDAPRRWRRKKNDQKDASQESTNNSSSLSRNESSSETPKDVATGSSDFSLTDDELDFLFNGHVDGARDEFSDNDDDESATENSWDDDRYGANDEWNYEADYEFLNDETVSDQEKIEYLRKRIDEGAQNVREELVRLLLQRAALAKADEEKSAMDALDEVERLLNDQEDRDDEEQGDSFENNREELLAQVLLQRPFFYLRNRQEPPMSLANEALTRIRKWAEESSESEPKRLLATAWQVHGSSLLASGADSAALKSLIKARQLFTELVDSGVADEVRPSIGFVCMSIGEAYSSIGDHENSLRYYREAIEIFDCFSDQESFLAEKVNTIYRLNVALRSLGKIEEADALLEEAIESEERLLSYDEESYFAPLTLLLEAQADAYAKRGERQEALAALERAISTLEGFLACDAPMSRRVLAYSHLENALRRRAVLHIAERRFALAARDIEKSLEYLSLATKKGDRFDPLVQTMIASCLICDLSVFLDRLDFVDRLRSELNLLFDRLSSQDRKRVVPLYAQLLLQRCNILTMVGKNKEFRAANNEAIDLLEKLCQEDDAGDEVRVALAKGLAQRGFCQNNKKRAVFVSLPDLVRAQSLLEELWRNDRLDDHTKRFFIDLLVEKSYVEEKTGALDDARKNLTLASRATIASLRARNWSFIDCLANLSRATISFAKDRLAPEKALQLVRLWLRYVERLRRNYVESSWSSDQEGCASAKNKHFLSNIEAIILDVKGFRINILLASKWEPNFTRYFDLEGFKDHLQELEIEEESVSANSTLAGAERVCRILDEDRYALERMRYIRETLADDPQQLAIFIDQDSCLRALRRRIAEGNDWGYAQFIATILGKVAPLAMNHGGLYYALAETLATIRLGQEGLKELPDKALDDKATNIFCARIAPLLNMQASVLGRIYNELFGQEIDETSEEADALIAYKNRLRAEVEKAFLTTINIGKRLIATDPATGLSFGAVIVEYFAWLTQNRFFDEGEQLIRKEGAELEKLFPNQSPTNPIGTCMFYDAASISAIDLGARPEFIRELLLKVEKLLLNSNVSHRRLGMAERLAGVYDRLGLIADEDKAEERLGFYRQAIEQFELVSPRSRNFPLIFGRYAQLLDYMLKYGTEADRRNASRSFHKAERVFDSLGKTRRRDIANAFWDMTVSFKSWYELERRCYHEVKRLNNRLEIMLDYFDRSTFHYEYRRAECYLSIANFWIRFNNWSRANASLDVVIATMKGLREKLEDAEFTETELASSKETALYQSQRRLLLAIMLKAQLLALKEHPSDPNASGSELRKALDEGLELASSMPETDMNAFPRPKPYGQAKEFLRVWIQLFGSKILSRVSFPRIGKFGDSSAKTQEDESPRQDGVLEEPETNSDSALETLVSEDAEKNLTEDSVASDEDKSADAQMTLVSFFMLRCFDYLYKLDAGEDEEARKIFRELIVDVRRVFGKDSYWEIIFNYVAADALARMRRWNECLRRARYVIKRFSSDALKPDCFIDNVSPYTIDALRIVVRACLERRLFFDLSHAKQSLEQAEIGCLYAFAGKRFFMRSIYVELIFLRAKMERQTGCFEKALEHATKAKRMLDALRRRGLTNDRPDFFAEIDAFLETLKLEVEKRPVTLQSEEGKKVDTIVSPEDSSRVVAQVNDSNNKNEGDAL